MSILTNIIKDLGTIASKVENFLREVEGEAPTIERITASTLLVVGPLLQTVVTMTAGAPAGALVGGVIGQIQTKLAAVSQLTTAVGTGGSVTGLLQGVSSDLSDLDSLAAIKDPKAQANLAIVIKDVEALLAAHSTAPAPPAAPAPAPVADPAPAVVAAASAVKAPLSPPPAAPNAPAEAASEVQWSGETVNAGPGLHAVVAP